MDVDELFEMSFYDLVAEYKEGHPDCTDDEAASFADAHIGERVQSIIEYEADKCRDKLKDH